MIEWFYFFLCMIRVSVVIKVWKCLYWKNVTDIYALKIWTQAVQHNNLTLNDIIYARKQIATHARALAHLHTYAHRLCCALQIEKQSYIWKVYNEQQWSVNSQYIFVCFHCRHCILIHSTRLAFVHYIFSGCNVACNKSLV